MTLNVNGYQAEGPYDNVAYLKNLAGVYLILGRRAAYENWNVLDIGESEDIKTRIANHDRSMQWQRQGYPQVACAPIYGINGGQAGRLLVEQQLRTQFNPPCGER